ncbi:MAG: hypothetical protein PHR35_13020 [Kiritimatiellae bacterium]|nr:hypothetical protein [Kiritimatiellia bacterium]
MRYSGRGNIHLNPVKVKPLASASLEGKRQALRKHPWSSYRGYAGLAERESRVDYRWLAIMGCRSDRGNRLAYRGFVEAMLGHDDAEFLEEIGKSRYAMGDDKFREETEEELKPRRLERMVTGDRVWPEDRRPALDVVADAAADVLGVAMSDVRFHGHRLGDRKALVVEWCCRLSDASQRKVAQYLGYGSESAVGKARKRAQAAMSQDSAFGAAERRLIRRLGASTTQTRQDVSHA